MVDSTTNGFITISARIIYAIVTVYNITFSLMNWRALDIDVLRMDFFKAMSRLPLQRTVNAV